MIETQTRTDCATCGQPFAVSLAEEDYYEIRGLPKPVNCASCRAAIRAERQKTMLSAQIGSATDRNLGTYGGTTPPPARTGDGPRFTMPCSDCGSPASVPFQPQRGRPVYCRKCFNRRRGQG